MGQDKNAANEGDQLKHCLLAEVLGRCGDWPSVTYAETHAGAGIYDAMKQAEEGKTHIRDLKELVDSLGPIEKSAAGGRYAHLLKEWWSVDNNKDLYPGSVLQAAIQLQMQFRVTEACPDIYERLSESLEAYGGEPRLGGFQDNIRWLTENENLVLLIDPFTYTNDQEALNKGHIDIETLTNLLSECWSKSRCVVGFWCAMGQKQPEGKEKQTRFTNDLRELSKEHSASFRWFKYGAYSIAWIGISHGRAVVDGIPGRSEWQSSWLKRVVKESEL